MFSSQRLRRPDRWCVFILSSVFALGGSCPIPTSYYVSVPSLKSTWSLLPPGESIEDYKARCLGAIQNVRYLPLPLQSCRISPYLSSPYIVVVLLPPYPFSISPFVLFLILSLSFSLVTDPSIFFVWVGKELSLFLFITSFTFHLLSAHYVTFRLISAI